MNRLFFLNHTAIHSHFSKNSKDFVVNEIPLYEFSGDGEHLILCIRKRDLSTWDMIKILSEHIGIKSKDIGYAGLKDKEGMTTQYISLPKKYEPKTENFQHEKIKILTKTYHRNKIKIGHLKANHFFIRLKKVSKSDAKKLSEVIKIVKKSGFPNYFGYQRFGRDGDNFEYAKEILKGQKRERNKRMKKFFISAYQSHLFNLWLSKRVEISKMFESFSKEELEMTFNFTKETVDQLLKQKHFFKILPGDLCHHYPYGKLFLCEDIKEESERFYEKKITLTGLLVGKKAKTSTGVAGNFEKDIVKEAEEFLDKMNGARRFAWIFVDDLELNYKESEAWAELNFTLPKGSYATVLLEELTHQLHNS